MRIFRPNGLARVLPEQHSTVPVTHSAAPAPAPAADEAPILLPFGLETLAGQIGTAAVRAAIHEATTTHKPGLVCPDSQGAHRDMDITTMIASAMSLAPYFRAAAAHGIRSAHMPPREAFAVLRRQGCAAERTMLAATGGVNTHKGLIFSLGILTAASGRGAALGHTMDCAAICRIGASFVRGIVERDFGPLLAARSRYGSLSLPETALLEHGRAVAGRPLTAGETFFMLHGITGIRGEAEQGFPHVLAAKTVFDSLLERHGLNTAAVNALLLLMRDMPDTNVLHRGGQEGLTFLRREAAAVLDAGGATTPAGTQLLLTLQRRCIERNISPGGCADLLAVVLFFHLLSTNAALSSRPPCF